MRRGRWVWSRVAPPAVGGGEELVREAVAGTYIVLALEMKFQKHAASYTRQTTYHSSKEVFIGGDALTSGVGWRRHRLARKALRGYKFFAKSVSTG